MSAEAGSAPSGPDEFLPYDLQAVYDALNSEEYQGEKRLLRPIYTKENLAELRAGLKLLNDEGKTIIMTDIFSQEITVDIEHDQDEPGNRILSLKTGTESEAPIVFALKPGTNLGIRTNRLHELARNARFFESESQSNNPETPLRRIQQRCPFTLGPGSRCPEPSSPMDMGKSWPHSDSPDQWDGSNVQEKLLAALEKNKANIREVKKIICFGLGFLNISQTDSENRHIVQHRAALDIAGALSNIQRLQNRSSQIEVFAQDPAYTEQDEEFLSSKGFQILKWHLAEALDHIDENTFIISISATSDILEPAMDLTDGKGPAGILYDRIERNGEELWYGRKHHGNFPGPHDGEFGVTKKLLEYKDNCICEQITDDRWFGHPAMEMEGKPVLESFDTELLLRKV